MQLSQLVYKECCILYGCPECISCKRLIGSALEVVDFHCKNSIVTPVFSIIATQLCEVRAACLNGSYLDFVYKCLLTSLSREILLKLCS